MLSGQVQCVCRRDLQVSMAEAGAGEPQLRKHSSTFTSLCHTRAKQLVVNIMRASSFACPLFLSFCRLTLQKSSGTLTLSMH
jgi:hypothetical protein